MPADNATRAPSAPTAGRILKTDRVRVTLPAVIIDTREQEPFTFQSLSSAPGTLDTGDYSLVGLTDLVCAERKSLPDLLGCVGSGRDRFKRELTRMAAYPFRCLIVEASHAQIEAGQWRSQLKPAHVLGSLASWMISYNLPIYLAGTHDSGAAFLERWLTHAARKIAARYASAVTYTTLPGSTDGPSRNGDTTDSGLA